MTDRLREAAENVLHHLDSGKDAEFFAGEIRELRAALAEQAAEPNRAEKLRAAGYTRRPTLREFPSDAVAEQAAPDAPAGWQLVPVRPTPEMVAAYLAANDAYWRRTDELPPRIATWRNGTPWEAMAESYRAMLAAAPPAPVAAPAALPAAAEPVAWIRFCSDGMYEGPITHGRMLRDPARLNSGAWTPLYTAPQAAPAPLSGEQIDALIGERHDGVPGLRRFARQVESAIQAQAVPAPQAEPDPADIIAGALQTSRAHAYELMESALRDRYPAAPPPADAQAEPITLHVYTDEDGETLRGYYVRHPDFYLDIERDDAGKWSTFFRDGKTKREAFVDQAATQERPAAPPPADAQAEQDARRIARLVEHIEALTGTLRMLDQRLRECSQIPCSAAEAYDSFYQHEVAAALAQTGEKP